MSEITMFLGKSIQYWIDLQRRVDDLGVEHLLEELVEADAKVRYYERMMDRMTAFRNAAEK